MADLIRFYKGEAPDGRGRMFADILAWSDAELEDVHDFIQWLFPSQQPSRHSWSAPTLDPKQIELFLRYEGLRNRLRDAFDRMLRFYGFLAYRKDGETHVLYAENYEQRRAEWLTHYNHNFLRISRILECLRTLGLPHEARAFFAVLDKEYQSPAGPIIGAETFGYWRRAALGLDWNPTSKD